MTFAEIFQGATDRRGILDRIEEDINLIREKCVCNGEEDYASDEDDDDSFDEDEEWISDSDES